MPFLIKIFIGSIKIFIGLIEIFIGFDIIFNIKIYYNG